MEVPALTELRLTLTPADEGQTVRHMALKRLQMSYGQFKRAKFEGEILLDGRPVHADQRVRAGQELVFRVPEPPRQKPEPCAMPVAIPYRDEHFWIVDKPAPFPSTPSARQEPPTLENVVYALLGQPEPFIYRPVNRLDKGTSGLMVVAMTAHAQHRLQSLLHTAAFQREYLAVCEGAPPQPQGIIDLPIGKAEGATIRRVVDPAGRPAQTEYRLLRTQNGRSLVWLRLETGRTHQIRVHLSALGCPVAGDFLYGQELPSLPGRFALHSHRIHLRHPFTGQQVTVESPLPETLAGLLGDGDGDGDAGRDLLFAKEGPSQTLPQENRMESFC